MNPFHRFPPDRSLPSPPRVFPSPFAATPHPLAREAAALLQRFLRERYPRWEGREGKMFGVLVVRAASGELGYLAGFSGMIDERWEWPGFVPPVFDPAARRAFLVAGERRLDALAEKLDALRQSAALSTAHQAFDAACEQAERELAACRRRQRDNRAWRKRERERLATTMDQAESEAALAELDRQSQQEKRERKALRRQWNERIEALRQRVARFDADIAAVERARRELSQSLQQQVFDGYRLVNLLGETKPLKALFPDGLVPGGAGDCAGPKLIHHAVAHGMTPVAMAEFWWGRPPDSGVRHHGRFYPACRGKCRPILPFMLRGVVLAPEPGPFLLAAEDNLHIVYRDEHLLVIDKPAGLLSVPGREVTDSVLTRLRRRFPQASGPLLVHRLDLGTSGLLLAALNPEVHKRLQRQFLDRSVRKRYVAIVAGEPAADEGVIELPLRVDLDDRPRQLVCHRHGKPATTRQRVVAREEGRSRLHLFPLTGRTHQLRVHAAHPAGLGLPIIGDELYGTVPAPRMMLHAEALEIRHPVTGRELSFHAPAPF